MPAVSFTSSSASASDRGPCSGKLRLVGCRSTASLNFFQMSDFSREMTFVTLSTKY